MKRPGYLPLWWMPLVLVFAPAFSLVPFHRDLVDFFAPMRALTASSIAAGVAPWLNLANGCGEAWFANPETAVLYPPAWLHLVMAPGWAMTLEIALHLAWFSFGVGLLARQLGSSPIGRSVTEAAAWSVGPVVFTVGVLNNLETLAWVPWMILAARMTGRFMTAAVAAATALAWLGGEPQIWAFAVVLTFTVSRRRAKVAFGMGLGALLVSIQLLPFVFWVLEGDRGPQAASWVLRGAVSPTDWSALLVPGVPANPDRMIYVESFFFGAPVLLCALLGAWRRKWLLVVAFVLGTAAMLPEIGGGELFLAMTRGLVRYPSRFAVVGLALILPMIGRGADDWLSGRGRWAAGAIALLTIVLCGLSGHPLRWWVAGVPAAMMMVSVALPDRRALRGATLAAGLAGAAVAALPLFGLQGPSALTDGEPVWPEAADGARIYSPTPAAEALAWFATGLEPRRLWPVGYLNLGDGLAVARTDSPVANGRLAEHIELADRGPESRWWLDTLAAPWVVLMDNAGVPDGMEEVRVRGGMRLMRNHRALELAHLDLRRPVADHAPVRGGRVIPLRLDGNTFSAETESSNPGHLWISLAPVGGWRWWLDGAPVELEQGPGIVQSLPVPAGRHELVGRYRPPGFGAAATLSLVAVLLVAAITSKERRAGTPLTGESAPDPPFLR